MAKLLSKFHFFQILSNFPHFNAVNWIFFIFIFFLWTSSLFFFNLQNIPTEINKTAKLAVIVYVHGGSFLAGGGHLFGPDLIVQQNVLLVTINYRLVAFEFLSLGTSEYSGNMGLKDQRLALKWIYDNIEHFGGDKTRITYSAQSSQFYSNTFSAIFVFL